MKRQLIAILVAALLWFSMFSPWTAPYLNFWIAMSASAVILVSLSAKSTEKLLGKGEITLRNTLIGVVSATMLWGIFWIGNLLATRWFGFAGTQIAGIYAMKEGSAPVMIALLLLLLIGPAEEVFWRGYIQNFISEIFYRHVGYKQIVSGPDTETCDTERRNTCKAATFVRSLIPVALTAIVYSLAHIWSFNFMLVMAALVCGVFWGLQYRIHHNLWSLIVSHALWDAAVFIVFPI